MGEVVVGIQRSGRQSLTGGCERNVSESRKEWQLVAEAQQKENVERPHRVRSRCEIRQRKIGRM